MSVVVTAVITPAPGRLEEALAVYGRFVDAVHAEPGCELYALHSSGEQIVIIEKWAGRADLDAHAKGPVLAELGPALEGLRGGPSTVTVLEPVAVGADPVKSAL